MAIPWYHLSKELPDHIKDDTRTFLITDNTHAFDAKVLYSDGKFYLIISIDMFNHCIYKEQTLHQYIMEKKIIYCGNKNRELYFIVNVKFFRGFLRFLQKIVKILDIGHWSVDGKHYDLYKEGHDKTDEELQQLIENFAVIFPEAPLYKQAKKK